MFTIQHRSRAYKMVVILYKRGGPHYYFQNSLLTMGCGKDLTEEEKRTIIKEISTGNTPGAIAKEIGRYVATVKRFVRSPSKRKPPCDRGVLKSVTKRDFWRLRRSTRKIPEATSAKIFEEAGLVNVPKPLTIIFSGRLQLSRVQAQSLP